MAEEGSRGSREVALRKLERTFECLTCVPVVGIVQRSDEKFWERCVFENFMCSFQALRSSSDSTLNGDSDDNSAEDKAEDNGSSSSTTTTTTTTPKDDKEGEEKKEEEKKEEKEGKVEAEKKEEDKKEVKEDEEKEEEGMDDLAMFVRKGESTYFVRRRSATQNVLLTRAEKETVDWQESFMLNMVMQQLYFELTVYVCRKSTDGEKYLTLNQRTTRVYPSTVKVNVKSVMSRSTKQDKEDSYPIMYFTMYDFDDVFRKMLLAPGLVLCVDLSVNTARSRFFGVPMNEAFAPATRISVFCGAIDYTKIDMAYAKQGGGFFSKIGKAFSRKKTDDHSPDTRDSKFVTVNGPRNVGKVQFCFNKHIVSNSTSTSPAPDADNGGVSPSALTPPPASPSPPPKTDKDSKKVIEVKYTEYQCMPYFLSLHIHEIVRAIVKKMNT